MCRWLAYSGSPISIEALLYTPVHSLIDQSLHSELGAETTNGDGFGVGWYDDETDEPGVQLYPDNALFASAGDETRLIVSEPLGPLAGAWNQVPESTCGIIQPGDDELRQFTPRAPGTRAHNGRSAVAPA
jgi:hypothetical protein